MINTNSIINKRWVRRAFDRAAHSYDDAAVLQREICTRLVEHLQPVVLQPNVILDVGTGTGQVLSLLKQRYKKAHLLALDIAPEMLKKAEKSTGWFNKPSVMCADAEYLPLKDNSVDMVVSNLMLQWSADLQKAFSEFKRVLKPGGVLMFSTFGPDTLKELRDSWNRVDQYGHVNHFLDMHDVGDALLQAGFADPVMDREDIVMTYGDIRTLMADLKSIGANTPTSGRRKSLMTPATLKKLTDCYESYRRDDVLPATYEVIYGQAWCVGSAE